MFFRYGRCIGYKSVSNRDSCNSKSLNVELKVSHRSSGTLMKFDEKEIFLWGYSINQLFELGLVCTMKAM